MTKSTERTKAPKVQSTLKKGTPSTKNRGYDEIAPFLREVNKIIAEECAKHDTLADLPWYTIWEEWKTNGLFHKVSINSIGKIICPELKYMERTVRQIINRVIKDVTPV